MRVSIPINVLDHLLWDAIARLPTLGRRLHLARQLVELDKLLIDPFPTSQRGDERRGMGRGEERRLQVDERETLNRSDSHVLWYAIFLALDDCPRANLEFIQVLG